MYHKESGTGNDPFLAGNMLCRRRSLSPLRISTLINLLRLFSIRERERLIISADDARSLWQVSRAHSALSGCRGLEISREMLLGKIDVSLWIPNVARNATRNSRGPLLLRYTSVGKHRVSLNCNKIKLEESYLLFVLREVAKHVAMNMFFWNVFKNKDV